MEISLDIAGSWPLALAGAVAGAIVGSFLATILLRWPAGRSASGGRSQCDSCGAVLGPLELVPILSHLLSRGRCRRCGAAIDRRHFFIELLAAGVGGLAMLIEGWPIGVAGAVLGWWLLILAALDAYHHWLPDRLTLPLVAAGLLAALLEVGPLLGDRLIGAASGFLVLWALGALYERVRNREGLGGGDPKLLAAIGAWLGWQALPLVLVGAGLIGISFAIAMRLKAASRLPLGTLLAASAWPLWLLLR